MSSLRGRGLFNQEANVPIAAKCELIVPPVQFYANMQVTKACSELSSISIHVGSGAPINLSQVVAKRMYSPKVLGCKERHSAAAVRSSAASGRPVPDLSKLHTHDK